MKRKILRVALCVAASAVLSACGGSDGSDAASGSTSVIADMLTKLGTAAGLSSPTVADAFDENYLDSGTKRPQVLAALAGEAQALGANPTHSLFPQVTLSNTSISACDANGVCTLTGTLVNADADTTAVTFSTKVLNVNGTFKLLGDQLAG